MLQTEIHKRNADQSKCGRPVQPQTGQSSTQPRALDLKSPNTAEIGQADADSTHTPKAAIPSETHSDGDSERTSKKARLSSDSDSALGAANGSSSDFVLAADGDKDSDQRAPMNTEDESSAASARAQPAGKEQKQAEEGKAKDTGKPSARDISQVKVRVRQLVASHCCCVLADVFDD